MTATAYEVAAPCVEDLATLLRTLDVPRRDGPRRLPPRDHVRAVQAWVESALTSPDFVVDCLARDRRARAALTSPPKGIPPFFGVPEFGVRVALAYWAPGRAAAPHEHPNWTVTAVVHNALEVETFDWARSVAGRRLVTKRVFSAERGRVGHIYEPCIHAPRNPTSRFSISMHVFAPQDGRLLDGLAIEGLGPPEGEAIEDPSTPLRCFLATRDARGRLGAMRAALGELATPPARALRDEIGAQLEAPTLEDASIVTRAIEDVPLVVSVDRGAATLGASQGVDAVFVRVSPWAAPALRFVAETETFAVAQIPDLDARDRVALARALAAEGVIRKVDGGVDA